MRFEERHHCRPPFFSFVISLMDSARSMAWSACSVTLFAVYEASFARASINSGIRSIALRRRLRGASLNSHKPAVVSLPSSPSTFTGQSVGPQRPLFLSYPSRSSKLAHGASSSGVDRLTVTHAVTPGFSSFMASSSDVIAAPNASDAVLSSREALERLRKEVLSFAERESALEGAVMTISPEVVNSWARRQAHSLGVLVFRLSPGLRLVSFR